MIGECNRQKHSRRALRLNISSVDIRGACCFRASCVHNVLAVKFAMRHCKQCVSNEASKRSRGPVRNWDVNFSSFRMCLPWHVPTALIALSLSISFSLSFLAPTRFFNFFFFFLFPPDTCHSNGRDIHDANVNRYTCYLGHRVYMCGR